MASPELLDVLAAFERARAAWPEVVVDATRFAAYVGSRLGEGRLEQLHTDDLYLACACAAGDPAALAAFDRACLAPLEAQLRASGADPAGVEDVRQVLRARFLVAVEGRRGIEQFGGRGALRGWVTVAALREVIRVRKKTRREVIVEDDLLLDRIAARDHPEQVEERSQCLRELRVVFRAALGRLSARERNVLRLYFIDRLSIDAIGEIHEVGRSTAARWIVKAEGLLRDGVRRGLKASLAVDTVELAGMWQAIESRIDVSIGSLLRSQD